MTMSGENRLWGTERIRGEPLKVGIVVSNRSIRRYRWRGPGRLPSQTWRTFLANHAHHAVGSRLADGADDQGVQLVSSLSTRLERRAAGRPHGAHHLDRAILGFGLGGGGPSLAPQSHPVSQAGRYSQ